MPAEPEGEERRGFWRRFSRSLEAGRQAYVADLKEVFGRPALDETFWDDLEATLIAADVGVPMTERVVGELRGEAAGAHLRSPAQGLGYLKSALLKEMTPRSRALNIDASPAVILVVGVNGSGKTTTIGKLAHLLRREGREPLLAAADTYRAAAIDQLRLWAERAFFFSSRRRHTSLQGDWSSDVCSSDLLSFLSTKILATMPKCSVLLLSIGPPFSPPFSRNLPSCVNFSPMPSPWPFPPTHTLP